MHFAAPALYALLAWWLSTGIIILLDNLPQRTFRWSVAGSTVLLGASLWGLWATRMNTSVQGAYAGFTYGLLAWAWLELTFYTGFITGPRKVRCHAGCRGWRHFGHALMASLWHELAVLAVGGAVFWLTAGTPNQAGAWLFLVLSWMHQSARLNVFLGVPNIAEHLLPDHLDFLRSFLRRRPMNFLFPVSVTASTVGAVFLVQRALAPGVRPAEATALIFAATMMVLAIAEHWFLVVPLPMDRLWAWSLRNRPAQSREAHHAHPAKLGTSSPAKLGTSSPAKLGTSSWSTHLAGCCDVHSLQSVLNDVASGGYGQVEQVTGVARAPSGWVRFFVAEGHAGVASFSPLGGEQGQVTATGRQVDGPGLAAAFSACAERAAA